MRVFTITISQVPTCYLMDIAATVVLSRLNSMTGDACGNNFGHAAKSNQYESIAVGLYACDHSYKLL